MPTKILRTANRTVTLDARPDRPDLRDRLYQPPLVSLPPRYPPPTWIQTYLPKYRKAQLILDQGQEGACTGFGLAAVINYLLFRRAVAAKTLPGPPVSARMLYHLARKYDEWPGEDYDGSSCRGAMKGWFHHGVCSEALWPYRDKNGTATFVPPALGWDTDAARRPLGAYYRVLQDSVADLQSAINEVGAVYVSSDVHEGWDSVVATPTAVPTIPWKPGTPPSGGHAFALVGYDADGFIVQNSWGDDWGFHGFARVTYDDWLTNGTDAWASVMGAPIAARAPSIMLSSFRTVPASDLRLGAGLVNGATAAAVAESPRPNAWDTSTAVHHTMILGNDGLPDHVTIEDANAAAAVDRVCYDLPKAWLQNPKGGGRRVLVYAHGGLNDLRASLDRAKIMGPWIEQNGIYPLFVAWQSGVMETIENIIGDLIGKLLSSAPDQKSRSLFDKVSDGRDYLIEAAAIVPARPVWGQMKQNAIAASDGEGGMRALAKCLATLRGDYNDLEVHLAGHSAGAILLGAFLKRLGGNGLPATTVSLYAPACTVAFATDTYLAAATNKIIDPKRFTIDVLSNENEENDTVGPYGKSLLYLVSRALEPSHKTPILGMEAAWAPRLDKENIFAASPETPNPDVAAWRQAWLAVGDDAAVLERKTVIEELPALSIPSSHDCFDNWIEGIERTLARILGLSSTTQLPVPIQSLRGF